MQTLEQYLISRIRRYNRMNYQMGYVAADECVYGLAELIPLAEYAGRFDIKDALRKKVEKLRELLLEKDKPGFGHKFSEAL